jgi:lipopolysaccharide/colanic/teichoic acid biosynthesis glycosyltransferase
MGLALWSVKTTPWGLALWSVVNYSMGAYLTGTKSTRIMTYEDVTPKSPIKVGYDEYYLKNRSFLFDIKILFLTLFKTVKSEGVQH